jgi:NADPH2:quinone reductase
MMNFLVTPEEFDYYTQEYLRLVNEEDVKILIHNEYPFSAEGVRQSQIDITGRGTVGKLLISIGGSEQ